jgi:serine/threonine-protein kinase RsbW
MNLPLTNVMDTPISLSVPADAGYLHVLRSVTAGVAAKLEIGFDDVDDLRIAVTESCNRLLALGTQGRRLTIELSPSDDGLTVAVEIDAELAEWPFAGSHETLAWRVISGLVDEAQEELRDGRPTIVLTKRTIAAGAR